MAYKLRRFTATIVVFHPTKAYGFCRIIGGRREAHFHLRDFEDATDGTMLRRGDKLEFYLEEGPQGLRAIRIAKPS
jgi:cold shock CspA family protein